MRLIDADAVKKFARTLDGLSESQLIDVLYIIANEVPTVDAVPVVRCKDCKHWKKHRQVCSNDDLYLSINDCGCYPDFSTNPDWFCAYGERRDA